MSIGDNIKKFRKIRRLTQQELASFTKISLSAIIKYENNQREPKTEMLIKIANALDVDLLNLIADNNEMIEEEDLKRLKKEVSDERIIYSKPSVIKEIDKKSKFYANLENVLQSESWQEEFNYKYTDLVKRDDFDEIIDEVLAGLLCLSGKKIEPIDRIKRYISSKNYEITKFNDDVLKDIDRKFSEILELEFFKLNK